MTASRKRTMLAMAGLPGTGKSTIAHELARRLGGIVLSKDVIRAELFTPDEIQFTQEQDDFCMKVLFLNAGKLFKANPEQIVIVDGRTFSKSYQVDQFLSQAKDLQATPIVIECVCDDTVARQRIEQDIQEGNHPAGNRTWQLYLDLKAKAEPITFDHLKIDTGREPLEKCVERCVEYIENRCER